MIKKIKNITGYKIFFMSLALLTSLFIAKGLFEYLCEIVLTNINKMQTITLLPQDFELVGIIKDEQGRYIATDSDPQLILNTSVIAARISLDISFSILPGEMNGYYTKKEGQGFSPTKRFWFYKNRFDENIYTTRFTLKKMHSIRIDPTTVTGNIMQINSITINPQQKFFEYFSFDFGDIFNVLVYSGIFSAIGVFIKEIVIKC